MWSALGAAGVQSIVLKGPSVVRALYSKGGQRPYVDADLLVSPSSFPRAREVLGRRGFEQVLSSEHPVTHAETWVRRRDQACVDLHRTILGIEAAPDHVWEILSRTTETMQLCGREVDVLGSSGLALHLALHAAQHGEGAGRPVAELAQALTLYDLPVWREAAALARELDAVPALRAGLEIVADGRALAATLGLPRGRSREVELRARTPPFIAFGIERLMTAPGARAKARILARELFPSAPFLRAWSPLARRGRVGLLAARLWRPLWLVLHVGPGLRAWLAAHRASHGDR